MGNGLFKCLIVIWYLSYFFRLLEIIDGVKFFCDIGWYVDFL